MKSTSAPWDVWISADCAQYARAAVTFSPGSSSSAASPMRTTPLISPPSWTSSRLAATSPCTTGLQLEKKLIERLALGHEKRRLHDGFDGQAEIRRAKAIESL